MAVLGVDEARAISKLDRNSGTAFLASCLNWEEFDEDDNCRQSILLDFLYDTLMFPIEKGFNWREVCQLFELGKAMQEETVGRPITDAVKIFQTKLQSLSQSVSERSLKIFSEYFFGSFMRHYKLFQYCFTREQDRMMLDYDLKVETPNKPEPLKTSKPAKIWDYEERLHGIEQHELERKSQRLSQKEKLLLTDADLLVNSGHGGDEEGEESDPDSSRNLNRESIKAIIREVTSAHVTAATHRIRCAMEESQEDLEFKLEKTSLPRPQVLGPPPRYKPKTPLPKQTSADSKPEKPRTPKSAKANKSRSSSRAGKSKA